jgi:hypothetical protein
MASKYPYTDRGITYYDIPVQTEYKHQILSDFQRNKMLDTYIDYLMKNPVQQNYVEESDWQDAGDNYGQQIFKQNPGSVMWKRTTNPQGMQNIHRMHGETNDMRDEDWNKLFGEERRAPASSAGDQDLQPNWVYINSLENFKELGGDIRMMNTADAYRDIDEWVWDSEGNYIRNPQATIGGVNVGETLSGRGGYFDPRLDSWDITLNPANVVKKYPTAPMGPDSEWEFLGPNEVNVNTPSFDPLRPWNLGRILPHETGHMQEELDEIWGWDEPNPGAYLEGTKWGRYADIPRHPRMHMMDLAQWDSRADNDKSLSKTQFANLQADQARSMKESLGRVYWGDDKTFNQDWERQQQGFGGSGRSRENRAGMWQDPSTIPVTKPGGRPNMADISGGVNQRPRRPRFNTGGLVSLVV